MSRDWRSIRSAAVRVLRSKRWILLLCVLLAFGAWIVFAGQPPAVVTIRGLSPISTQQQKATNRDQVPRRKDNVPQEHQRMFMAAHDRSWFENMARLVYDLISPSTGIHPAFVYSMPRRYGLDLNRNGMIDLPNSFEYVNNTSRCQCVGNDCRANAPRFEVLLDASGTQWPPDPRIEFEPVPGTTDPAGEAAREAYRRQTEEEHRRWREVQRTLHWKINGQQVGRGGVYVVDYKPVYSFPIETYESFGFGLPDATSQPLTVVNQFDFVEVTDSRVALCLPEGGHTISLTARDAVTNESKTIDKLVIVDDFLFVTIGDSYGSGEGTPDAYRGGFGTFTSDKPIPTTDDSNPANEPSYVECVATIRTLEQEGSTLGVRKNLVGDCPNSRYVHVLWADDGAMPPLRQHVSRRVTVKLPGHDAIVHTGTIVLSTVPDFANFGSVAREHDRAHRSTFAASSLAALDLEARSNQYSVTFVNLAMSGATISKGLRSNFNGRKNSRFTQTQDLVAQLDQLRHIVGSRQIDALYISVGGNDIGFANVVEALLARNPPGIFGGGFADIAEGVRTGNWDKVENTSFILAGVLEWGPLAGLDRLRDEYFSLVRALQGFKIRHIYISEYPDPTAYFRADGSLYYCEQILDRVADGPVADREIDAEELQWAYENVLVPLNDTIRASAAEHGWVLIDGLASASDGHGMCAGRPYHPEHFVPYHPIPDRINERMRWFRGAEESAIIQADGDPKHTTGTLHPNEFGHSYLRHRMVLRIRAPDTFGQVAP